MRILTSALFTAFLATGALAADHRDARELAPAGLIGPWKADLAASTYAHAKPVREYRTFAYDADGKVLEIE